MKATIFRLESKFTDVIIRCDKEAEIIYWGPHLQYFNVDDISSLSRPVANSRVDVDVPITLAAENGRGLFSVPGLEGHRDGLDAFPIFIFKKAQQQEDTLVITTEDDIAGLRFVTELKLSRMNGVLQIRNILTNLKEGQWNVNRLAVTLPLPTRANQIMAFNGRWAKEFQPHRILLEHGGFLQENRRGRTSHEYFPGMMIGPKGFSEEQGEVWGIHLGWSGNHRMRADIKSDGRRQLQAEALYFAGEMVLAKNQSLATPWVYAAYSLNGLNGMSQQFHQFLRDDIIRFPKTSTRPVHLNTWEGIYFDHNPEYINKMATEAAKLGVERFIIDDGWFKHRHDDHAGLGDWYLDEDKYPNGLKPVIDHVKSFDMEFGIWVEPEMINPDSDLFRAHPEWVLGQEGYQQPTGRFQYVLDLSNPDVYCYLFERMSWLLGNHDIDYVKWDMNRELVQATHLGKASADNQTREVYRLFDELNEKFPHVEFESCSSGGGRIDFEILKRSHRFWASDNNDALERQTIQKGMSYFFPPEIMGAHIGNRVCHATGRQHTIEFRGLTALLGHMGIELDPIVSDEKERAGYAKYIKLHQSVRDLIHSGTFWRIDMADNTTQVQGVVGQDKAEAVFVVSQLAMPEYALSGQLHVPGLQADAQYRVVLMDDPNIQIVGKGGHTMRVLPHWMTNESVYRGEWLSTAGLELPVLDPETAILIKFEKL